MDDLTATNHLRGTVADTARAVADCSHVTGDTLNPVVTEEKWKPAGPIRLESGLGRNASCPCGSGRKYKKCCRNRLVQLRKGEQDRLLVHDTPYGRELIQRSKNPPG